MKMNLAAIGGCKNPALRVVLQRLAKYERYCALLEGSLGSYVRTFEKIGKMPDQLKEWLKIFDGGLLFTVSMFSTRGKAEGKFNRLLTFSEVNSAEFKEQNQIPQEVVCFAMTNYGNYYCYIADETSGWVYEWDAEQGALIVKWDSFALWLDEMIDLAEEMMQEGLLDPRED